MVEQRMIMEVGSGREIAMASSSTSNTTLPQGVLSTGYFLYPTPTATYEEVVASPVKFMETLENLHAAMGSKFKIPIVGGHELDLHRLFVEVTYRGGLAKVLQEKKWKDVTGAFSFPSSATNASFILRKYYYSLLVHYEQIYFFREVGWNHETINALQSSSRFPAPHHKSREMLSSTNTQATESHEFGVNPTKSFHEECSALAGSSVHGVIDGKFDGGYLITVKIGSEELKGVLYQSTCEGQVEQEEQESSSQQHYQNVPIEDTTNDSSNPAPSTSVVVRRKRRKKSEIRKRDPAHPKPNRSGYNFFFQEQHARLKVLYPGKDREISRMIGDSWNKLNENEKSVYQEKAARDKERYKMEMEGYRQRLKTGNNMNNNTIESSISIQHSSTINLMNMVKKLEHDEDATEEAPSHPPPGIETSLSIAVKTDEDQLHSLQAAADNNDNNNNVIIVPISQSIPCNDQTNNNNNSILDTNLDKNSSMIILPSDTVPVQSLQLPTDLNTSTIDLEKEFQTDQENETCSSSSKTQSINLHSSSDMFFKDRIPVPEQQQQAQEMNDDRRGKRSNFEDDDRRLLQMEKRDDEEEGDERILSQNSIDVAAEERHCD